MLRTHFQFDNMFAQVKQYAKVQARFHNDKAPGATLVLVE